MLNDLLLSKSTHVYTVLTNLLVDVKRLYQCSEGSRNALNLAWRNPDAWWHRDWNCEKKIPNLQIKYIII